MDSGVEMGGEAQVKKWPSWVLTATEVEAILGGLGKTVCTSGRTRDIKDKFTGLTNSAYHWVGGKYF